MLRNAPEPKVGAPAHEEAAPTGSLLIPVTLGAVFFMEGLDSTIISTSLPQIARSLHIGTSIIGVTMTAYFVSVSMWIGASGWLADRFESRRVFLFAIGVFLLGSVMCGLSHGLVTLVLGRFVQGAGGALMMPIGRLILARSFPRHELVHAMSFMIIPGMAGPMLGPVIGGWITTYLTWRWIFFVNVPLGFVGVGLTLRYLKPHPGAERAGFDALGFFILAVGLVAMQGGLELMAARRGFAVGALLALALAVAAFLLYGLHARRPAPIMDLRLFRYRAFAIAVLGGFLARVMLGSTLFLFPLLFQLGLKASALVSGVLMGLLALGQIVVRPALNPILGTVGIRMSLIGASILLAALMAGLLLWRQGGSLQLLALDMLVFGFIQSVLLSTLAALSLSGMPNEALGAATSISAVFQRLATATGIAVSSILLAFIAGTRSAVLADFTWPLLALSAVMLGAAASFALLKRQDGADLLRRAKA